MIFHKNGLLRVILSLSAAIGLSSGSIAQPSGPAGTPAQAVAAPQPVSADAQSAYKTARDKLFQIRTLRRKTNTQNSVGSGFVVRADGLIVTNFHVASAVALEPDKHRMVAVSLDNVETEVDLIAFDVQHDLALLRPKKPKPDQVALLLRPASEALKGGERIYSLGNPLDVGFAVTEGTYNGLVQRSFYPRIFFGGTLNPGMSGGPALDSAGRVLGINVAKRTDGEQVSFLIPVGFAQGLIERGAKNPPITKASHAEVTRQLLAHQAALVSKVLSKPFKAERHAGYKVPVPDESQARCWGSGRNRNSNSLFDFERSDCRFESDVFAGDTTTGSLHLRYEAYDGSRMSTPQFAVIYSASFANERFATTSGRGKTADECTERFVDRAGLPMRAVMCLSAYRKLEGLYDLSLLVATVNQNKRGVQGRLDARGVSFDSAVKLSEHYLNGFAWEPAP